MFDDAAHRFGIQVCALNLPRSPRRRLRHRKQFRFNKSTNRGVAHTAMARRLRQAEDLPSSLIVRTSACNCMFPPDIGHAGLTPGQTVSRAPVQFVEYSIDLAI